MKFFEVERDFETDMFRRFGWSETPLWAGVLAIARRQSGWLPSRDIRFEHGGAQSYGALAKGGRLTPATLETMRAHYAVAAPTGGKPMEVIDCFSIILSQMPLVSAPLARALEVFGDALELVESTRVTDGETGAPVEGGPFWLINVLDRRDGWDRARSEIVVIPRADGTSANAVHGTRRALRADAVADGIIWRDSLTSNVLCSDRFREVAQAVGCGGWFFREVPIAD
jgi:hypothetical protein